MNLALHINELLNIQRSLNMDMMTENLITDLE